LRLRWPLTSRSLTGMLEIPNTISGFAYGAAYQPVDEADHVAMHATCAGGLWASI